jgi:hypothetical protein
LDPRSFFCDPARFGDVWVGIRAAVRRFAGDVPGNRDTWASLAGHTAMAQSQVEALFDGWAIERFEEEDNDGEACSGLSIGTCSTSSHRPPSA